MTRALVRVTLVLLLMPWLAAAKLGDVLPAPEVGYRAIRVMNSGGQRLEQMVYAMPGFERIETETGEGRAVTVVDRAAGRWTSWVEGQGFFVESASARGFDPYGTEFQQLEVEELGGDGVGGIEARKVRVTGTNAEGAPINGHLWLTGDDIMLRIEGEMVDSRRGAMPFTLQLEELEIGPQTASLFERPEGLQPAPTMPALQSLLEAARGAGGPAADTPQAPPDAAAIQRQLEEAQRQIQEMMKSMQPPQ